MGTVIPFPIQIKPTDYWQFYDNWAKDGYWASCTNCHRPLCFRAGKGFVACAYHSDNLKPPQPYNYKQEE